MNRSDIAHREATRDPIFLLQTGHFVLTDTRFEWDDDRGPYQDVFNDYGWLDEESLLNMGAGEIQWDTERVFLTREEGEEYALQRAYDYGEKGRNWRVYCVPCEGELADILKEES